MQHAAYWSAPDDATLRSFDVAVAHMQARNDADRVLQATRR